MAGCRGGERKGGRIIYSGNMATAIDDRQELLEQFQAVSLYESSVPTKVVRFRPPSPRGLFPAFPRFGTAPGVTRARFLIDRRFYHRRSPPSCREAPRRAGRAGPRRVSPPCQPGLTALRNIASGPKGHPPLPAPLTPFRTLLDIRFIPFD